MADITPEELADALIAQLKDKHHTFWIDPELHSQQHEFIRTLIAERAEKMARRKAIEDRIAGSLLLGFVLTVVGLVGAGFLEWVRNHIK